jgi:HPr kinase/phosphorylase
LTRVAGRFTLRAMERVRGTCIAIDGFGLLLRGRSGAGKSDLALRLIDGGAVLVADDYTVVFVERGELVAAPPPELAGLLEVRGIGIVRVPAVPRTKLAAVVDLIDINTETVERMPEREEVEVIGVPLPRYRLAALHASSPARIRLIAQMAIGRIVRVA